jgi:ubiquitin C-terminal hydrolase
MTALVASIQPHGFGENVYNEEEDDEQVVEAHMTNDLQVEVDGLPRSRYSLDDADSMQHDEASVASSSSIPSMNDMEDCPPAEADIDETFFTTSITMEEEAAASPRNHKYGGLNNLGNTCYLNSAFQMVASLDDFLDQIRRQQPVLESNLRNAVLDVLERLGRGETLRPDAFKGKIDERSPLFVGYRQQDSHEFLTTLLDLLDEDYKKKEEEKQEAQDEDMEDAACSESSSAASTSEVVVEEEDSGQVALHEEIERSSPIKKQRLEGDSTNEEQDDQPFHTLSPSRSFMDLQFNDIENLLHGNGSTAAPTQEAMERQEGPKLKLVGGRMNPAGAGLHQLEDPCVPGEAEATVKTLEQEDSDSAASKSHSPVDAYFTTEVRVCLTCDSCKYRRSHTETYLHLSLEIGPNCPSVEDGLRKFFAPEKREIKCEKCFCETAMQTTEITKLPRAMLFHLKRFIVDVSPDYTSISYRKDQSPVSFEDQLTLDDHGVLANFMATDVSLPTITQGRTNTAYGLRSVVNHIGSSASCGHYTADAKRVFGQERDWTRFNDSIVSTISSIQAVDNSSQTAYMILYEIEVEV